MGVVGDIAAQYRREARAGGLTGGLWLAGFGAAMLVPLLLIATRVGADVALSLVAVLFLGRSAHCRQWAWLRDPVATVGLVAWGWLLAISPLAADVGGSFGMALPWARYVLFYAAMRHWLLRAEAPLCGAALSLAGLLGLVAVDTLWQYRYGVSLSGHVIDHSGRLTGPLNNVKVGIYTAKLLLPAAGISLWLALRRQSNAGVVLSVALLLGGIAIVMLSGERTAFFGLLLGAATATSLAATADRRMGLAALTLLGALLAGGMLLYETQPWVQVRAEVLRENLSGFRQSPYGQLFWAAEQLGREHWLTGTGLKGFRLLCPQFVASGAIQDCNLHPHNPYLEWFAETGLPGALLFTGLVGSFIVTAGRVFARTRGIERLLPAMALGTVMVNFFPLLATQSNFSNWPGILLWYSLSLAFAPLGLFAGGQPQLAGGLDTLGEGGQKL